MLPIYDEVVFDMLKGFKCKRCGACCFTPRIYAKDIKNIEKLGHKDFIFTDNFGSTYIKEKPDGKCHFLKQGKIATCLIHKVRPSVCRAYPSKLNNGSCKPVEFAFDIFLKEKK